MLRVKLPHLESWNAARAVNAGRYAALFAAVGLAQPPGQQPEPNMVRLPTARLGDRHVFNQFAIRVDGALRDPLREFLKSSNGQTHQQPGGLCPPWAKTSRYLYQRHLLQIEPRKITS